MPIPESQLDIWSNSPGTSSAEEAYASIRATLTAANARIKGKNFDVYLQGSYRSTTNVRSDSDVDVVIELKEVSYYDFSLLPSYQWQSLLAAIVPAAYGWADFRADVGRVLRSQYGQTVEERSRCWKVPAAAGRLAVDVVPSINLKRYRPLLLTPPTFDEGIYFEDRCGVRIQNFPRQHYDNGVAKNSIFATGGEFKPSVRMFKNARSRAVERGLVSERCAPSYFVDCLLWNVPDGVFSSGRQTTFVGALNSLARANLSTFFSRNALISLFGSSPQQWSEASARELIGGLIALWERW